MSASGSATTFIVPWSYRAYRALILVVFTLIMLLVALGAAGHGPADSLHQPTNSAIAWVKKAMGINEISRIAPRAAVKKKVNNAKKAPTKVKPKKASK